jgi:hypothetical protein
MLKKSVIAFIAIAVVSASAQFNPQITRMRNGWSQWGAQVSSMHFESKVTGLVARTVLTISFKDVQSTTGSDSMEVNFNFNLPTKSVIDSMYLWINGKPQNAALKERWSAVSAYWQVVGRRWDPALLTKWSGDAYNLRVFPFSHGEERTVQICYSTPLSAIDGKLSIPYPIDMASGSVTPVRSISGKISIEKISDSISVSAQEKINISKSSGANDTVTTITFTAEEILPVKSMRVTIDNKNMSETGMCSYLSKKEGADASFISVLDPKIVTGATNTRPKNVAVIWNMVGVRTYRRYQYYNGSYDYSKYKDTVEMYYNYSEYNIKGVLDGLKTLLSRYMQQEDKFNLLINNGSINQLYPQQTGWAPETESAVTDFINKKISKASSSIALLSPLEFLKSALNGLTEKQIDLILIDQTYSYQYPMDTAKIDTETNLLLSKLPENATVFGLIGYNWYNPIARIQNTLIQKKNGMAFYSWGDQNEIFGSIGRSLTPRIFPATVSFSCGQSAFVYDVNGPIDDRIFYGVPVVYTGKIRGVTDTFSVQFTYDLNNKIYKKETNCPVHFTTSEFDPVEKIWAASRVEKLLYKGSSYAYNEYSDALNISLKYRILTNQTALIAFEPGLMSESWYKDDQPKGDVINGGSLPSHQVGLATPVQPTLNVSIKAGLLKISINGLDITSKSARSLKLFDLKGRLIADLTKDIVKSKRKVELIIKTSGLASGVYVIRFAIGKNILQQTVTIR